jgi:hypothetical protein
MTMKLSSQTITPNVKENVIIYPGDNTEYNGEYYPLAR